jgi:Lrp/AsnC family transcriptional regulator, regulator for asnA, asnC and gidA
MARNPRNQAVGEPVVLDDIDRELVSALQRDGRRPFSRLATEIGIGEGVVRYRVQRLERAGILQIVGIADPLKVGFDLMALIGIRVVPGRIKEVADAIATFGETSYVASLAGAFDLIVEVVCRDTAHFTHLLTQQIHHVDGVVSTESFLIMEIHKMAYGWDVRRNAAATAPPPAKNGSQAKSGPRARALPSNEPDEEA